MHLVTPVAPPPSALPLAELWEDEERAAGEPTLVVDVDGFEGPLDLLLYLARTQKVDLARLSVLALAEQYIAFVERARNLRIELAADYLVMAAWLAFLKSRLLIPERKTDDEASGEELAAMLQLRLRRLEAMREAASRLMMRNRLGRDVFARGMPEPRVARRENFYAVSLYDLLSAYASRRQRTGTTSVSLPARGGWSLMDARERLERMIGSIGDWTSLDSFLLAFAPTPRDRASALASSFAASLELVREGRIAMRQDRAFGPLFLKAAG